jgi:homocysteine S-methyltransferase
VKNLDVQLKRLERKLNAGAQYVMTQPIFDPKQAKVVFDATKKFGVPILLGVMPLLHSRNTEFLHNEVPGIVIPDDIRERMRGKEGEAGVQEGLKIARELAAAVLACFKGIYLITPFLRYELTADLGRWIRAQEKARKAV